MAGPWIVVPIFSSPFSVVLSVAFDSSFAVVTQVIQGCQVTCAGICKSVLPKIEGEAFRRVQWIDLDKIYPFVRPKGLRYVENTRQSHIPKIPMRKVGCFAVLFKRGCAKADCRKSKAKLLEGCNG